MVIILRKKNLFLVVSVFLLTISLYGINILRDSSVSQIVSQNTVEKKIILDPGHGGEDPGAVSDYSGLKEKDVNLSIALKLKELLTKDGYNVLMTRDEDILQYSDGTTNIIQKRKQDLLRRKKIMDDEGANIVVSIHLNKFGDTKYFGAQTFFPPNMPQSQKLASTIQKCLQDIVDKSNTRQALVKKEPIIILKNAKTTTAIVECGFLSNSEEEKKLQQIEYQDKLVTGIHEGIKKYFNLTTNVQ